MHPGVIVTLRRTPVQAHYTLAGSYSYGGSTGNRSGAGHPQVWDQPFAETSGDPTEPDERHRFVLTGVFEAPYGVQLSPVVHWASARAYNPTAGTDRNRISVSRFRLTGKGIQKYLCDARLR